VIRRREETVEIAQSKLGALTADTFPLIWEARTVHGLCLPRAANTEETDSARMSMSCDKRSFTLAKTSLKECSDHRFQPGRKHCLDVHCHKLPRGAVGTVPHYDDHLKWFPRIDRDYVLQFLLVDVLLQFELP